MYTFILAIFLSAFLLFQVQPIIARYILPWYGGSPAVWTTCMLFFQVGLLAGYTYAHLLVSRFRERPRLQVGIHLALLVLSLLILPITPAESLKPTGAEPNPSMGIVKLLALTVGLPYIVISASGPLLQHWFGSVAAGASPYRLYAVSNFGSLLGLLTYPVLFEPNLRLGQQTGLWSFGFVIYAVLGGLCAWKFVRIQGQQVSENEAEKTDDIDAKPTLMIDRVLWVVLAGCGSLLLLATTNQMCQDVAVVPFLWVLPLGLYLITFIIAFDHARWYVRGVWMPIAALFIGGVVILLNQEFADEELHMAGQIFVYAGAMFASCMVCHGEMVRLKPHPRYLTAFYLAVSLGGALGGAFVSLVAPRIFTSYWELHVGLVLIAVLAGFCFFRDLWRRGQYMRLVTAGAVGWGAAIALMGFFLKANVDEVAEDAIATTRGFYGILRVYEGYVGTEDHFRALFHGKINHGRQFLEEPYRYRAYDYYGEISGPGLLLDYHPNRDREVPRPMKLGVIGLGVGVLAAYADAGDSIRIYEINSQVEDVARTHFSYLEECQGEETVVLGDARITLEQELAAGESQQFDALFVDAFSGDSIPVHLLTREAFEVYFQHLKEDGVLAVHITNRHLDLSDPVRQLAADMGKENLLIVDDPDYWEGKYSEWVLIANNRDLLAKIEADDWHTPWYTETPREIRWTDDYSNLLQVVYWD